MSDGQFLMTWFLILVAIMVGLIDLSLWLTKRTERKLREQETRDTWNSKRAKDLRRFKI